MPCSQMSGFHDSRETRVDAIDVMRGNERVEVGTGEAQVMNRADVPVASSADRVQGPQVPEGNQLLKSTGLSFLTRKYSAIGWRSSANMICGIAETFDLFESDTSYELTDDAETRS